MNQVDPDWRPIAFKEWQLVTEALVRGEQSVILRKGGISEGKAGFQWLHDRFFLFPSRFHQQVEQVNTHVDGSKRELLDRGETGDDIVLSVFIETINTGRITDWESVQHLDPYHIWKEEVIRDRFEWGDEPGVSYAVVKAFAIDDPWILNDREAFGGCRSWLDLPPDESGGWRERLEGARPIEASCGIPDELNKV